VISNQLSVDGKHQKESSRQKRIVIKHSLLSEKTAILKEVLGQFHDCKSLTNLQYLVNISSIFMNPVGNHNPWEKISFTKEQD